MKPLKPLEQNEAAFIKATLSSNNFNITATAKYLQINRVTLYRKLWKYKLIKTKKQMTTTKKPIPLSAKMQQELAALDLSDILPEVKSKLDIAYDAIITADTNTIYTKDLARKFAPTDLSILILGETGTGKELFAKLLHGNKKGEFISVNCGGIPETLIEGEFFGSVKGAFTGATDKAGYFEQAQNGTIFLDEIAELDRASQSKLLRVIQEKKVRRLGDNKEISINCRIVSATNHSVEELRNNNKFFRQDLFYRLAGYVLHLKPLRQRGDDAQLIADMLTNTIGFKLPTDTEWQGNIRELINYIEATKILGPVQ